MWLGVGLVLLLLEGAGATPVTDELVALGCHLFFDPRLSADGSKSCASCHQPDRAFGDGERLSTGVHGRKGRRRSQPLADLPQGGPFFWDGRARTLVEQARGPLFDPVEMGNRPAALVRRLSGISAYRPSFVAAFGDPRVDVLRITEALAAYQSTLVAPRPALRALVGPAQRGLDLFLHRARCSRCHRPTDGFGDGDFHNLGVGWNPARATPARPRAGFSDAGRFEVTGADRDVGAFKTPKLFQLSRRAPYMHDGSLATLREVIAFYDRGGTPNPWLDPDMTPLGLSDAEKADLLAFLESFDSDDDVANPQPCGEPDGTKPRARCRVGQ